MNKNTPIQITFWIAFLFFLLYFVFDNNPKVYNFVADHFNKKIYLQCSGNGNIGIKDKEMEFTSKFSLVVHNSFITTFNDNSRFNICNRTDTNITFSKENCKNGITGHINLISGEIVITTTNPADKEELTLTANCENKKLITE